MNKFAIAQFKGRGKTDLRGVTRRVGQALAVGALVGTVGLANAAAIDVADLVTDIGAQAAPVGLVGVAVLMIYGAVKAFKWVRAALS